MAHSHYDIYRDRLAAKYPAFGHALLNPSPEVGQDPVKIGDVGYVHKGKFIRLFNALLPASVAFPEGTRQPEYYEPLVLDVPNPISTSTVRPHQYCSAGVNAIPPVPEYMKDPFQDHDQFSFSCAERYGGAVLSLPVDARCQDALFRKVFGKWMIQHIDSWFAFAQDRGHDIDRMEEIILVTGCHHTRSWANVTFLENQAHAQASFGVQVAHDIINWKFSLGEAHGAVCGWGPEGRLRDLRDDQCVFIRGFRVVRPLGIFPKQLKAEAGPNPCLDGMGRHKPDRELASIPTPTKNLDRLHVLLDYIVQRSPSCDMALIHDDDLARIVGFNESGETPQSDVLMAYLQRIQPEIRQIRCSWRLSRPQDHRSHSGSTRDVHSIGCLSTDKDSAVNGTGTTTVAIFLGEFDAWSDSNSNMPKPAGVTDHLNLSDSVLASTETVQSDAGGSSFDDASHYVNNTTRYQCFICERHFPRAQEMKRHLRSFLPYWIYCPFTSCPYRCNWSGNLTNHWRKTHAGSGQTPPSQPLQYQIYDPDPLVRMVIGRMINMESAVDIALSHVQMRAQGLGKGDVWARNWWGRRVPPHVKSNAMQDDATADAFSLHPMVGCRSDEGMSPHVGSTVVSTPFHPMVEFGRDEGMSPNVISTVFSNPFPPILEGSH